AQNQEGGVAPSDLLFAIYLGKEARPNELLLWSPDGKPEGLGDASQVLSIGDEVLLLTLAARGSLVGGPTRNAAWLILAIGRLGSLALAVLVEAGRRRRDHALQLVADLEQRGVELDRALGEQQRAELDARATAERLAEAEETYRTLVERLPLVTYVDRL